MEMMGWSIRASRRAKKAYLCQFMMTRSSLFSYISAFFLLLFFAAPVYSQAPSGKVSGSVFDQKTGQPVAFATVALLRASDSVAVTGGMTDEQGAFVIEQVPVGSYRVNIRFIGYVDKMLDIITLAPGKGDIDLGRIQLAPKSKQLDELVITEQKDLFTSSFDKKVFEVGRNLVSATGSANNILQNIPSVSVDIDGNVSLRGSGGVTILIDGKPSGLTGSSGGSLLDQIPAGSIERVEIITNPSARYDADGMAGIINIILKKNRADGFNGSVTASIGTRDKYNSGLSLNYRTKKLNISSNYNYRHISRYNYGNNERENRINGNTFNTNQFSNGEDKNNSNVAKVAADYDFSKSTQGGLSVTWNNRDNYDDDRIRYENRDMNDMLTGLAQRNSQESSKGNTFDLGANFRKVLGTRQGHELTASSVWSFNNNANTFQYSQQPYTLDNTPTGWPTLSRQRNGSGFNILTVQTDYVNPLSKEIKLEAGLKAISRHTENKLEYLNYDSASGAYIPNTLLNNEFIRDEQVYSAYSMLGVNHKSWVVQGGLRFEQTQTLSRLVNDNSTYRYNYPALFPSLYLGYKVAEARQVHINYSRRINRPGPWTLNPFTDYTDPLNLRYGNPYLKPEFINSTDIGYDARTSWGFITTSVYWRRTTNGIQRVISVNDSGVSSITFANLATIDNLGAELVVKADPFKWWSVTASVNLFQMYLRGDLGNNGLVSNQTFSWTAKLNNNFKIRKGTDAQLSGYYNAPTISPQGTMMEFYSWDASVKQDLWKGKASVGLTVNDIFNTLRFRFEAETATLSQQTLRKRETRMVYLTFTYKFGKADIQPKRQRQPSNDDGGFQDPGGM